MAGGGVAHHAGFCYAFFYIAACIYVDAVAPKDIRASAQSLINGVTIGLGSFLGSLASGRVAEYYTNPGVNGPALVQWREIFAIPAAIALICFAALFFFFKSPREEAAGEKRQDSGALR